METDRKDESDGESAFLQSADGRDAGDRRGVLRRGIYGRKLLGQGPEQTEIGWAPAHLQSYAALLRDGKSQLPGESQSGHLRGARLLHSPAGPDAGLRALRRVYRRSFGDPPGDDDGTGLHRRRGQGKGSAEAGQHLRAEDLGKPPRRTGGVKKGKSDLLVEQQ